MNSESPAPKHPTRFCLKTGNREKRVKGLKESYQIMENWESKTYTFSNILQWDKRYLCLVYAKERFRGIGEQNQKQEKKEKLGAENCNHEARQWQCKAFFTSEWRISLVTKRPYTQTTNLMLTNETVGCPNSGLVWHTHTADAPMILNKESEKPKGYDTKLYRGLLVEQMKMNTNDRTDWSSLFSLCFTKCTGRLEVPDSSPQVIPSLYF